MAPVATNRPRTHGSKKVTEERKKVHVINEVGIHTTEKIYISLTSCPCPINKSKMPMSMLRSVNVRCQLIMTPTHTGEIIIVDYENGTLAMYAMKTDCGPCSCFSAELEEKPQCYCEGSEVVPGDCCMPNAGAKLVPVPEEFATGKASKCKIPFVSKSYRRPQSMFCLGG